MRRGGKRLLCFVEGREDLIKDMILPEDGGYPWGDQLLYYPEVFYYKSLAKVCMQYHRNLQKKKKTYETYKSCCSRSRQMLTRQL